MDGFVSVNICDLRQTESRTGLTLASVLKTIIYKQVSTGRKQEDPKSKTGTQGGDKDYGTVGSGREGQHRSAPVLRITLAL
jgi:hypothetical protein